MRALPITGVFDEESLDALEAHAEWILKEIGIEFRGDPGSVSLFREAGASVQSERVRFDEGLASHLCATAPPQFIMHGRDPGYSISLGSGTVSFTPGYGSPFVTDRQ